MKRFLWTGREVQATKNKEESCSFLDAIGRCSCSRSADWLKIDMWENPSFDSSGSRQLVGMLRCALSLSSDWHFDSRSSLACLCSVCISLGMQLKTKFTPAVSSVQSLTPPPSPLLALEFVYKTVSKIVFIPSQNLVSFKRRQDWLKKAIFERFQIFNQLPVQNLKLWDTAFCGRARGSSQKKKQNSYF